MIEPLLGVYVSGLHIQSLRPPPTEAAGWTRRVVVVAEAFAMPVASWHTAHIVEALVRSGATNLVGLGDAVVGQSFARPPVTLSREQREQLSRKSVDELGHGQIQVEQYLADTLPQAELLGVNHADLLEQARIGRFRRLSAIGTLYGGDDWRVVLESFIKIYSKAMEKEQIRQALEQTAIPKFADSITWACQNPALLQFLGEQWASFGQDWRGPLLQEVETLSTLLSAQLESLSSPTNLHVRVPILDRLESKRQALYRGRPGPLSEFEALLTRVREGMIPHLPALVEFARRHGLEMNRYPALQTVYEYTLVPEAHLRHAQSEYEHLRKEIISVLARTKGIRERELRRLFEVQVRKVLIEVSQYPGLLATERPLAKTVDCESEDLRQMAITASLANQNLHLRTELHLLDLASMLGLRWQGEMSLRNVVHLQAKMDVPGFFGSVTEELAQLEEELVYYLKLGEDEDGVLLYELGQDLRDLDAICREECGPRQAARLRGAPPSCRDVAELVGELGGRISDKDRQEADLVDRECVPGGQAISESSFRQQRVMADELLRSMDTSLSEAAVLLCGGFHAEEVARELHQRHVACSIITPRLSLDVAGLRGELSEEQLAELKASNSSATNIRIVSPGVREHLRQQREGGEVSWPDLDNSEASGSREWAKKVIGQVGTELTWATVKGDLSGEALQECRVCYRRAPFAAGGNLWVAGPHDFLDIVLLCPRCPGYVCGHCAGRRHSAFFAGHGRADAERAARFASILVCNIHGTPLLGRRDRDVQSPVCATTGGAPGVAWYY